MSSMIWTEDEQGNRMDITATHPFFETPQFTRCQGVGFANDGNHVNTWREAAHQLDIDLPQPEPMSGDLLMTTKI